MTQGLALSFVVAFAWALILVAPAGSRTVFVPCLIVTVRVFFLPLAVTYLTFTVLAFDVNSSRTLPLGSVVNVADRVAGVFFRILRRG